jgi:glycosyltransferase 2 family protein
LLLGSNVLQILSFLLCARALGIDIGMWQAAIVFYGMSLASVIPLSIGGWGIREGVGVLLLANSSIEPSAAAALGVLLGLTLTVVAVAGALVWMNSRYQHPANSCKNLKLEALNSIVRRGDT